MTKSNNKWFVRSPGVSRVSAPRLRMFCFPYAGGSASTYMQWGKKVANDIEVLAVQLPGRANRLAEQPYDDMNSLIAALLPNFLEYIDRPYVMFGHSLGSRIAFQLMVECRNQQRRMPEHFFASGSRAAHRPCSDNSLHGLNDDQLKKKLFSLNGTPTAILENDEMMRLCMPFLRADFKIAGNYRAQVEKINCPVTVFGGYEDPDISQADLWEWAALFAKTEDVHLFRGGHFFVETHQDSVLEKVNLTINKLR